MLTSLRHTASRLGVPATWLRAKAEAGRIPHLRAGNRLLFNLQVVEQLLADRAAAAATAGKEDDLVRPDC